MVTDVVVGPDGVRNQEWVSWRGVAPVVSQSVGSGRPGPAVRVLICWWWRRLEWCVQFVFSRSVTSVCSYELQAINKPDRQCKPRVESLARGRSNKSFDCMSPVVKVQRLPLCSRGQSSWLQIQRSGFDSRRYQIFREVVRLERGPLSTAAELLERKSSASSSENRDYGCRGFASLTTRCSFYLQKLVLTSWTSGGRSVRIVR
jgi:hypothetical protein